MLSVVEHFSKMRLQFSQFMSAFAALRFIRWAYTKLRELAGLLPVSVDDDGGVGSDVREDELCVPSILMSKSENRHLEAQNHQHGQTKGMGHGRSTGPRLDIGCVKVLFKSLEHKEGQ